MADRNKFAGETGFLFTASTKEDNTMIKQFRVGHLASATLGLGLLWIVLAINSAAAQTTTADQGPQIEACTDIHRDWSARVDACRTAAEQGLSEARYRLGTMYLKGRGMPRDADQAGHWYRLAAEQGHAKAQHVLGTLYAFGQGVPKDLDEALRWYRLAAEQGNPSAQYKLGTMYDRGHGTQKNHAEAVRWYRAAAEYGDPRGQFNLATMYHLGHGTARDYGKAIHWLRLAAKQQHVGAQYSLGLMHSNGDGVLVDHVEAARWQRKAAEEGLDLAQLQLSLMYLQGRGVDRDLVLGYMWLELAAGGSQSLKAERDKLTKKMTPEQVAEARQMALAWSEKHQERKPPACLEDDTEDISVSGFTLFVSGEECAVKTLRMTR